MERTSLPASVLRAARLDPTIWRQSRGDPRAHARALVVVGLAAGAEALGVLGTGVPFAIGAFAATFAGWFLWGVPARLLAPRASRAPGHGVQAALGLAQSPRMLALLGLPFQPGWALSLILGLWLLLTATVALRETLDVGTGRALLVALPGWAVAIFLRGLFAW